MRIEMAHVRDQGIDFAVFNADPTSHADNDRAALLERLTMLARRNRMHVDKAALAFTEFGRIRFFGTPDLVKYLAMRGVPRWTHTLDA